MKRNRESDDEQVDDENVARTLSESNNDLVSAKVKRTNGNWNRTPLHGAARNGHAKICQALIEFGAKVDPEDDKGWTPFGMAVYKGHVDCMRVLLDAGADVNQLMPEEPLSEPEQRVSHHGVSSDEDDEDDVSSDEDN